jgi:hypothetical protein
MEREIITQIGPVCRFGPGGDYVSVWPVGLANPAGRPKNAFGGLLNVLAGMIDALRGNSGTQRNPYYVSEDRSPAYATAGSIAKNNRFASEQRWLFADDWRTGGATGHKAQHRIRAHRAVAGKRTCFGSARAFDEAQGTLFDADCEVARTA